MTTIAERFLNYVSIDTQSAHDTECFPSTEKQKNLGRFLVMEMKEIGIEDVFMDTHGYVYGTVPSNINDNSIPAIGFIAHMDTSPDVTGKDVKPRIVKNYDGKNIVLNKEKNIVLSPEKFTKLKEYIGQDIIVTDGTTLLGADDKVGIADIITMAEYFINNPHEKHGTIKIAFTPDEEVGRGADYFDVEGFGADFAYTVDNGYIGKFSYENFNAATAKIKVNGISVHPAVGKNKLVNSILIGMEFHNMLPVFENPAFTDNREGFSHLTDFSGGIEATYMKYIIRDHDKDIFNSKKERFRKIADYLNGKYGSNTVNLDIIDSYYNMKEKILPHMHIVDTAVNAMETVGVKSEIIAVRGGTDGARLSYMGLPCPNICTGGDNSHSRYEYVPIQSMEKSTEILIEIVKSYAR